MRAAWKDRDIRRRAANDTDGIRVVAHSIPNDIPKILGLLVQASAYADESLPGFLCRLARINGLPGRVVIAQFRSKCVADNQLRAMLATVHPAWSEMAREMLSPSTRPMPVWNLRRRRFCSKCLAESAYWRGTWDLSLATVCSRHKTALRDTCPHCSCALTWDLFAIDRCPDCGKTLSRRDEAPATSAELWFLRKLTARHDHITHQRGTLFHHLDLTKLHELAFRLGACAAHPNARKPLKIAGSASLAIAREIALSAAQALWKWPKSFFTALDHIRAGRDADSQWKVAKAVGPIYREIFVGLSDQQYQFLREAFGDYLLQRWQAPLALRHRRLSAAAVQGHRWLPIQEAASRLGIAPSLVTRLANSSEIPNRTQTYQSGRVARIVDAMALAQLAPALRNTLTVEETAEALGLPKPRVRQLIEAEILKVWGGTPERGMRWRIDQASVQKIVGYAEDAPTVNTVEGSQEILGNLLRYRINGAKEFVDVVSRILGGENTVVGRLTGVQKMPGWIVHVREIDGQSTQALDRANADRSVVQVAKELGVKQEVAYALVRHGFINSRQVVLGKRRVQVVRQTAITAFRRQYVLGTELAKTMNMNPRTVVDFLKQRGVFPIAGPAVANRLCRQYLWRRTKKLAVYSNRE